ncbi:MAG TPA: response regulator [Candidatus Acidoferrum sp.]|nr:response regulator [Candidatus Acidoferrum sp.]
MGSETLAEGSRPTILCIDDDRLVLGICTGALEERGYRVVMATHGLAGIEAARKERPDLILLDIMMPDMDGFEVCESLRAEPDLRRTPIVLLTAMNKPDLESKGADAGATLTLRKPFSPDLVVRTVEDLLGRKAIPERREGIGDS